MQLVGVCHYYPHYPRTTSRQIEWIPFRSSLPFPMIASSVSVAPLYLLVPAAPFVNASPPRDSGTPHTPWPHPAAILAALCVPWAYFAAF